MPGSRPGRKPYCGSPMADSYSPGKTAGPWSLKERAIPKLSPLLLWLMPLVFLAVFFFLPLGMIFRLAGEAARRDGLDPALLQQVLRPLGFTLYQAGLSTLLTLLVGLPAAYVFARFTFPGKGLLRMLTTLPFILPTVVVA